MVLTFSEGGCSQIFSDTATVEIKQIPVIHNVNTVICSQDNYVFSSTNALDVIPNATLYTWNLVSMTPVGNVTGNTDQSIPVDQFSQTLTNNSDGIVTLVYSVTPIAEICTGNPFTITIEVYPKPDVIFSLGNQTICNNTNSEEVVLTSSLPGNITFDWLAFVPSGINGATLNGTNIIPAQQLENTTNQPLIVTYNAFATFNNNGNSCIGEMFSYTITVNPTLSASGVLSNYNGFNVSVFGGNDGFIDLTTIGGSGNYTYSWFGPNGFSANTEDINNLFAGTYTVSISDGYCPPLILIFNLTQPPELLIGPDLSLNVNLLCFGDSNGAVGVLIIQESVPPYSYQLFDNAGQLLQSVNNTFNLNPQFTGLTAGFYTVIVTDANGGFKTVSNLEVTQPADIIIQASTTPITCYGANDASITLVVIGGVGPFQAQWDNFATGLFQNNLAAGNYSITITDANFCVKNIIVNIPEAPIFTINPSVSQITCHGANNGSIQVDLIGGIQPISLSWNDGSNAGLVRNNLPPGAYTVTITDSKPCTIVRTFIIVEPQPLVLSGNVTQPLDCNNASSGAINLIISGGTPPFTYQWTNGSISEDLTGLVAGNYSVLVTDANGCTANQQFTLIRPAPLQVSVDTQTNANCETRTIIQSFVAQGSGGVPPYSYQWSSGNVSGANGQIMQTNINGTVILTVIDALGCTVNYTVNVQNPIIGNSNIGSESFGYQTYGIYSINDPIQFFSNITGDYINVVWDFGDGTYSNELNPIHTYLIEREYIVTMTVTYPFGCVYTLTISLLVEKGYLLVIPTGFTPNRDGLNDTYRPVAKRLKNIRMDVYDSWGTMIYSESGDVLVGWDGKIKGMDAENGNYHTMITAETFYGETIQEKQTFVLIK